MCVKLLLPGLITLLEKRKKRAETICVLPGCKIRVHAHMNPFGSWNSHDQFCCYLCVSFLSDQRYWSLRTLSSTACYYYSHISSTTTAHCILDQKVICFFSSDSTVPHILLLCNKKSGYPPGTYFRDHSDQPINKAVT